MKSTAVTIFMAFRGIFSAILLPMKTLNPIATAKANTNPINIERGAVYLAANKPEAIWVLSPNSLSRTSKNEAMKGVLDNLSFFFFVGFFK